MNLHVTQLGEIQQQPIMESQAPMQEITVITPRRVAHATTHTCKAVTGMNPFGVLFEASNHNAETIVGAGHRMDYDSRCYLGPNG